MKCNNKRCRHNENDKCKLNIEEISITNVGECAKESWRTDDGTPR